MHDSVMEFCRRAITDARGKRVLEVGAYDVNGSIREFVEDQEPEIYIGTDLKRCDHYLFNLNNKGVYQRHIRGCCADIALPAERLTTLFKEQSFDIAICTEVMEHVEDWDEVICQMNSVLKMNGYMVITTRSPGFPYHEYPIDKWRFTKENFDEIFAGWKKELLEDDPEAPGVFVKAIRTQFLTSTCDSVQRIFKP